MRGDIVWASTRPGRPLASRGNSKRRKNVKPPPKQGLDTSRGGCYLCARRCFDRLHLCRVMLDLVLVHFGGSGRSRGGRGRRGRCCRGRCRSLGERGGSEQRCNQSGSELLHLILQKRGGEATILCVA